MSTIRIPLQLVNSIIGRILEEGVASEQVIGVGKVSLMGLPRNKDILFSGSHVMVMHDAEGTAHQLLNKFKFLDIEAKPIPKLDLEEEKTLVIINALYRVSKYGIVYIPVTNADKEFGLQDGMIVA